MTSHIQSRPQREKKGTTTKRTDRLPPRSCFDGVPRHISARFLRSKKLASTRQVGYDSVESRSNVGPSALQKQDKKSYPYRILDTATRGKKRARARALPGEKRMARIWRASTPSIRRVFPHGSSRPPFSQLFRQKSNTRTGLKYTRNARPKSNNYPDMTVPWRKSAAIANTGCRQITTCHTSPLEKTTTVKSSCRLFPRKNTQDAKKARYPAHALYTHRWATPKALTANRSRGGGAAGSKKKKRVHRRAASGSRNASQGADEDQKMKKKKNDTRFR